LFCAQERLVGREGVLAPFIVKIEERNTNDSWAKGLQSCSKEIKQKKKESGM